MPTMQLLIGPNDHGRKFIADEMHDAEYQPGYLYEVIDGRFCVSPATNAAEGFLDDWLRDKLRDYSVSHPEVISYLNDRARVFVPDQADLTVPEPDLACFHDFPLDRSLARLHWEDVSPLLVVEVLINSNPEKDLVRNVELYFAVPSITEYWIFDGRENPDEPFLIARRRKKDRWLLHEVAYGETFSTPTLPGFSLLIDPRQ